MRRRIIISADVPAELDDAYLASYISEALRIWGGHFAPDDPEFDGVQCRAITIRGTTFNLED